MIYVFPDANKPIRQGDIFADVPRITLSLDELPIILDESGPAMRASWETATKRDGSVRLKAVLPITPVPAIVITQDCDALRAPEISLCEIKPFLEVEGLARNAKSPKSWQSILTKQARVNLKWFYLPPDRRLRMEHRMAVDFRSTIRVPRVDLERWRHRRLGRLNALAYQHFRERLSQFFRRYAYNEWYPLDAGEMDEYQRDKAGDPSIFRYPWQART